MTSNIEQSIIQHHPKEHGGHKSIQFKDEGAPANPFANAAQARRKAEESDGIDAVSIEIDTATYTNPETNEIKLKEMFHKAKDMMEQLLWLERNVDYVLDYRS